ncbi:MAG TPA: hypothetical protein VEU96_24740 [Bryobacteraceae bacterium]|nr:hypothetical protein [Bryobacteraceae bacterium]
MKIMSVMLGLSLMTGTVTFAADKDTTKSTAKRKVGRRRLQRKR